jgi:nitrogen fixation protein NifX
MSCPELTDEVALRIGLAVRLLPGLEIRTLMDILIDLMGQTITAERLARLRIGRLRKAADGLFDSTSDDDLRKVLALLKGQGLPLAQALTPSLSPYRDGDMPSSIRVACTSDSGEQLNGHFGACNRFLIYQVSACEVRLIEVRNVPPFNATDDKNAKRAELIRDCHVLYTASIGGPAAAKVVRAGLHPIKVTHEVAARELIGQLQTVLRTQPPPWLAKVMGEEPAQRVRFALSGSV